MRHEGNGGRPCANCTDRGEVCVANKRRRPRNRTSDLETRSEDSIAMAQRLARLEALLAASSTLQTSQQEVDSLTHRESATDVSQATGTTLRRANDSPEGLATLILEESQAMECDSRITDVPRAGGSHGGSLNFLDRAPPPEATSGPQQTPWPARSPTLASSMRGGFPNVENRASSTGIEPVLASLSPHTISTGHRGTLGTTPAYSSVAGSGGPSTQDEQEGNSVYASETVNAQTSIWRNNLLTRWKSNWEYHGK